MINSLKYFIPAGIVLGLLVGAVTVLANPSFFPNTSTTATATSTVSYITTGAATTTLYLDTYTQASGNPYKADNSTLLVQFVASSTASILGVSLEYALGTPGIDCTSTPTACDWYANDLLAASTTPAITAVAVSNALSWTFASSSQGGGAVLSSNNRSLKIFDVQTPTRYVRAVFSVTGANGAIWAAFQPIKQNP